MTVTTLDNQIQIRAIVNKWISDNLPNRRVVVAHSKPKYNRTDGLWEVLLLAKKQRGEILGYLSITKDMLVIEKQEIRSIETKIDRVLQNNQRDFNASIIEGNNFKFVRGDGVESAKLLEDKIVDLLITDPPYGISNPYTCEKQIPRRLRKNGSDFIMPKGHFGDWDYENEPTAWAEIVLPKVGGWAVIFCAQEQIGEYSKILKSNKFNAVGTFVWQKTNPVPFNHKFKPVNAWEAIVLGKRPGTKFNGGVVHNIITYKSPSPQERIHPTQKPVMVIEKLISLFSDKGDYLFDPFAGSATSVIASINTGRNILAYEKDNEFYQSAYTRIEGKLKNE